jgi:hypothetical protein
MLIRSQDKKSLINMDNVTDLSVVSGSEIIACYTTDQGYQRIGKYSDETKAIKVLDMIQSCYTAFENRTTGSYDYTDCCVFQMPSDEEVEG